MVNSSFEERHEDFNFFATVTTTSGDVIRRVQCRLWLPVRMRDRIRLVLSPNQRQARKFQAGPLNPFAFNGQVVDPSGRITQIEATKVWAKEIPMRSVSRSRVEMVFEADPIDLHVFSTPHDGSKRTRKRRVWTSYLITPSLRELTPFQTIESSYTGDVKVKTIRELSFTLDNGAELKFRSHFHSEKREDGTLTFSELEAVHEHVVTRRSLSTVDTATVAEIDDFLALVSFSARQPVACIAIDSMSENADHLRFYRRNVIVPDEGKSSWDDSLIPEFEEFIRVAYPRFVSLRADGLLRHALYLIRPRKNRNVAPDYPRMYAALETIVLWHRRRKSLEFIIEDDKEWEAFRERIGKTLKKDELLATDKTRRGLIKGKLEELRRVPFGVAFTDFCREYGVDLSDLWPVTGRAKEMPLSEIRNRIVHGSIFDRSQLDALYRAGEHLEWTIERMLLGILGWPIERSNVRPDFLSQVYVAMRRRDEYRKTMQSVEEAPASSEQA